MSEQENKLNIKEKVASKPSEETVEETPASLDPEKEVVTAEHLNTEIPKTSMDEEYYKTKETDHNEIVNLIAAAEEELADLKLRKSLMEADFPQLLEEYKRLIIPRADISTIAKKTLLEYFSYELLRPLNTVGLAASKVSYDTWESKHFLVNYQLDSNEDLAFNFQIDPIDQRHTTEFMPLIKVSPSSMTAEVDDDQVLVLIRMWHAQHIFSMNQLSLVNYDLNLILNNLRHLGFEVKPSLLDNQQALKVGLDSDFPLVSDVLDDIFITTMENKEFDFEKLGEHKYQILLDQNQKMDITQDEEERTKLFIDSNNRKRSILDFFTSYPFLVPLMVREI